MTRNDHEIYDFMRAFVIHFLETHLNGQSFKLLFIGLIVCIDRFLLFFLLVVLGNWLLVLQQTLSYGLS